MSCSKIRMALQAARLASWHFLFEGLVALVRTRGASLPLHCLDRKVWEFWPARNTADVEIVGCCA